MAGVFVDRFEGPLAVLIEGRRERRVDRSALPKEAREGDWLSADLGRVDRAARVEAETAIAARRARLAKGDDDGDLKL